MLKISPGLINGIIDHAEVHFPIEVCGLISGVDDDAYEVYRTRNDANSAVLYQMNPLDYLKADRDAQTKGFEIIGVYHSHTSSEAFPSPTDLRLAPDPNWHYVIVSLKLQPPQVRSFRMADGAIVEEDVLSSIM